MVNAMNAKKNLAVLGATGSIGCSTLDIVRQFPDRYRAVSLTAGRNVALLARQIAAIHEVEPPAALHARLPITERVMPPDGRIEVPLAEDEYTLTDVVDRFELLDEDARVVHRVVGSDGEAVGIEAEDAIRVHRARRADQQERDRDDARQHRTSHLRARARLQHDGDSAGQHHDPRREAMPQVAPDLRGIDAGITVRGGDRAAGCKLEGEEDPRPDRADDHARARQPARGAAHVRAEQEEADIERRADDQSNEILRVVIGRPQKRQRRPPKHDEREKADAGFADDVVSNEVLEAAARDVALITECQREVRETAADLREATRDRESRAEQVASSVTTETLQSLGVAPSDEMARTRSTSGVRAVSR